MSTKTMLILLSPSKKLMLKDELPTDVKTSPVFIEQTWQLMSILKKMSAKQVSQLMEISENLGILNRDRFQNFATELNPKVAYRALAMFKGDVYDGLNADSFTGEDLVYAQNHLRILSGLYGLLRPLDMIQPYRLEMGTGLENKKGRNLYAFWGEDITNALNSLITKQEKTEDVVINLASNEYSKSVKSKNINAKIVTVTFKEKKGGKLKAIMLYVKQARGMMARYIIKNRLENVEDLKHFNMQGYRYDPKLSSEQELVFIRDMS